MPVFDTPINHQLVRSVLPCQAGTRRCRGTDGEVYRLFYGTLPDVAAPAAGAAPALWHPGVVRLSKARIPCVGIAVPLTPPVQYRTEAHREADVFPCHQTRFLSRHAKKKNTCPSISVYDDIGRSAAAAWCCALPRRVHAGNAPAPGGDATGRLSLLQSILSRPGIGPSTVAPLFAVGAPAGSIMVIFSCLYSGPRRVHQNENPPVFSAKLEWRFVHIDAAAPGKFALPSGIFWTPPPVQDCCFIGKPLPHYASNPVYLFPPGATFC